MPDIELPDGKKISFSKKIDGFEIANKISKSLIKDACIMSVDGELKDLSFSINKSVKVKIITAKDKEGLEVIRHDAAHILAMAVQELFPGTQVTIGPVIEHGFYYDFSRKESFLDEDLKKIESKMKEIVDRDELTKREIWKRNKAISHFKKLGEHYKAEIIEDIPKNEDPIDLANSIVAVMQKDYNSIKSVGFEGRKNVLKKFDVDKMCQTTFTEYKKLIELS